MTSEQANIAIGYVQHKDSVFGMLTSSEGTQSFLSISLHQYMQQLKSSVDLKVHNMLLD